SKFEVSTIEGGKVFWTVEGGTLTNANGSQTAEVAWDLEASAHSIQLTPYSINDAAGPPTALDVTPTSGEVNTWIVGSGTWANPQHWSLGRIPLACDNVSIPDLPQTTEQVLLPQVPFIKVKSLILGQNTELVIPENTTLVVGN